MKFRARASLRVRGDAGQQVALCLGALGAIVVAAGGALVYAASQRRRRYSNVSACRWALQRAPGAVTRHSTDHAHSSAMPPPLACRAAGQATRKTSGPPHLKMWEPDVASSTSWTQSQRGCVHARAHVARSARATPARPTPGGRSTGDVEERPRAHASLRSLQGLEPVIRPDVWPFLLELFEPCSTYAQRRAQHALLVRQYQQLLLQCQASRCCCTAARLLCDAPRHTLARHVLTCSSCSERAPLM